MIDEGLPGVEEIEVATLDRGLRLEFALTPVAVAGEVRPEVDHLQRTGQAVEVAGDRLARRDEAARRPPALDRLPRRDEPAAHGEFVAAASSPRTSSAG